MTTLTHANFTNVVDEIESAPQNQRVDRLISGIARQMQQSGDAGVKQFGDDLQQAKNQLSKACQQQG